MNAFRQLTLLFFSGKKELHWKNKTRCVNRGAGLSAMFFMFIRILGRLISHGFSMDFCAKKEQLENAHDHQPNWRSL